MPERFRVIITKSAFRDLDQILESIQSKSPQNASLVVERVLSAVLALDFLPKRHAISKGATTLSLDVRAMIISSFKVFYRVQAAPNVVYVLAVRHAARRDPDDDPRIR